jgi:hypothetical protein
MTCTYHYYIVLGKHGAKIYKEEEGDKLGGVYTMKSSIIDNVPRGTILI